MIFKQIAETLNQCAWKKACEKCEFRNQEDCRQHMVNKMGEKIRNIMEEGEDDGR